MPAPEIAHLYKRKRWELTRRAVFARDGYVCQCGCEQLCTGTFPDPDAPVCDHIDKALDIVADHGEEAFYDHDRLQTLRAGCHDRWKQAQERRGYSTDVGADGWPMDPLHPANRLESGAAR